MDEFRPLQLHLNQLARADGSARFAFGTFSHRDLGMYRCPLFPSMAPNSHRASRMDAAAHYFGLSGTSSAIASFSGPLEVRLGRDLPDRATLEINYRPLEGVGGELPALSTRTLLLV